MYTVRLKESTPFNLVKYLKGTNFARFFFFFWPFPRKLVPRISGHHFIFQYYDSKPGKKLRNLEHCFQNLYVTCHVCSNHPVLEKTKQYKNIFV